MTLLCRDRCCRVTAGCVPVTTVARFVGYAPQQHDARHRHRTLHCVHGAKGGMQHMADGLQLVTVVDGSVYSQQTL